jgi:hypothetical protein
MSSESKPRVLVGMPNYDGQVNLMAALSFISSGSDGSACVVVERASAGGSLLARSFNMLWAQAVSMARQGLIDYFVMQHADIAPAPGYVDRLVSIAKEKNADVVSVVSPIKDQRGLTSTGLCCMTDRFVPARRFTMREVTQDNFPQTFCSQDLGHADKALLINTGCFIADVRKGWAQAVTNGCLDFCFSIDDRIRETGDKLEVGVEPEDWKFSRHLHNAGATVYATTEIELLHFGPTAFSNSRPWGKWEIDQEGLSRVDLDRFVLPTDS